MRLRLLSLLVAAAALAGLLLAGCGGGGGSQDPSSLVPPSAPVYVEATVRPEGNLKTDMEALAKRVAGVEDLGQLLVEEAEKAASASGESLDYEKEVEPWLGEKAGLYLENYAGEDFHGYGIALQVTDTGAAQEFIDKHAKSSGGAKFEEASYEGVDFRIEPEGGEAIGIVGDFIVFAESRKSFEAMVDASKGEALADQEQFGTAMDARPSESLAEVYVDIGALIEQAGSSIDSETELFFEFAGIEPKEATAVASIVPGSDQIEVDFSTDLTGAKAPSGDASKLLGSFPAGSVAALVAPEYGRVLGEGIDQIDAQGIPGQIPPHQFKQALSEAGIDLEAITDSIGDIGVFVEGSRPGALSGAVVLETKGASEAKNTVANIGLLLRASGTPGVTAVNGRFSGFSVPSSGLGPKPIVVAAGGNRIAIGYGLPATAKALAQEAGPTLAGTALYKEAVAALGDTPISGFAQGPAALRLVRALLPPDKAASFDEARPYLRHITYAALGAGKAGDLATAKLIIGIK